MEKNGIPFKGPVGIIIAKAPHVSDPRHILSVPVFDDSHQTGNVSFHLAFIENVGPGKAVMGKGGRIIGNHDGDGTLVSDRPVDPFIGQGAAHHAFLRRDILRLCFRFGLGLRLGRDAFRDGFLRDGRGFFRGAFLFPAARKEHGGGKPKQKQYAQFFHLNTSLS